MAEANAIRGVVEGVGRMRGDLPDHAIHAGKDSVLVIDSDRQEVLDGKFRQTVALQVLSILLQRGRTQEGVRPAPWRESQRIRATFRARRGCGPAVGCRAVRYAGAVDLRVASDLQIDHEGIIEIRIFIDAILGIAPGVADHAGVSHSIIKAAMGMAMQPQCRLPILDPRFEVRDKA